MVMVPKVSSSDSTPQVFHLYMRYKYIRRRSGFNHFIFDDAHAGFGNGHFRERDSSVCGSQSGGTEDFVNLFLSETGIFTLGFLRALQVR